MIGLKTGLHRLSCFPFFSFFFFPALALSLYSSVCNLCSLYFSLLSMWLFTYLCICWSIFFLLFSLGECLGFISACLAVFVSSYFCVLLLPASVCFCMILLVCVSRFSSCWFLCQRNLPLLLLLLLANASPSSRCIESNVDAALVMDPVSSSNCVGLVGHPEGVVGLPLFWFVRQVLLLIFFVYVIDVEAADVAYLDLFIFFLYLHL